MAKVDLVVVAGLVVILFMMLTWFRIRPRIGYLVEGIAWGLASACFAYGIMTIEISLNPMLSSALFMPLDTVLFRGFTFLSQGGFLLAGAFFVGFQQRATSDPMGGMILTYFSVMFGMLFSLFGFLAGELGIARVALELACFSWFVEYAHLWVFPKRKIES